MTALEARHNFTKGMIWLVILGTAGFAGLLLATNVFLLMLLAVFMVWLGTIPYHTRMSAVLSFCLLNASFVVPFVAQRPTVEEGSVFLAWTGIIVTLALRRQHPDSGTALRAHKWLWISYLAFALVVFLIMRYRHVGFGVSGATQAGGRRYLRQLASVAAPFAFLLILPGERLLRILFLWHCLLSLTFVVAEFALTAFGGSFNFLLYFVELPYDALNFASIRISGAGGVERYQSLQMLCQAGLVLAGTKFSFKDLHQRRAIVYGPIIVMFVGLGLLSGHRFAAYFAVAYLIVQGVAQRFLNIPRFVAAVGLAVLLVISAYTFARQLPLSVQRALCVLPEFPADPVAAYDAQVTMDGRRYVREFAWSVAPQYRWIGRGFSSYSGDLDAQNDPLLMHLAAGIWYNGTISLLINTGLPGLFLGLTFLILGGRLCIQVIGLCRKIGFDDAFSRVACSMACWWLVLAFALVFLEGSAEQILSNFGILSAFLIACQIALQRRLGKLPTLAPVR